MVGERERQWREGRNGRGKGETMEGRIEMVGGREGQWREGRNGRGKGETMEGG